jgi:hypothetical protein
LADVEREIRQAITFHLEGLRADGQPAPPAASVVESADRDMHEPADGSVAGAECGFMPVPIFTRMPVPIFTRFAPSPGRSKRPATIPGFLFRRRVRQA